MLRLFKRKAQLNTKTPLFIESGETQLGTLEANQSRFVTKCRWVLEVINSHLKTSFRAISKVNNRTLPPIMDIGLLVHL